MCKIQTLFVFPRILTTLRNVILFCRKRGEVMQNIVTNWYVLFVQTGEEQTLCNLINDNQVHAFYTRIEFYKRIDQKIHLKPLFPGYVFCQTDMGQLEFDEWLRKKPMKIGLIKELKYDHISALTDEEITILKRLLDKKGILRLSKGIKNGRKFHIISGPLLGMDDYITKYDSQHRLATIDLFFIEQQWQAGVVKITEPLEYAHNE